MWPKCAFWGSKIGHFLPRYRPSPQLLAHSGQFKLTTVRGITFYNSLNFKVGLSAILALEDLAKMRVLGARSLVCHYIAHHHNCWHIQANPRQPQFVAL
jgi:hypothetical protein